MDKKLRIVDSHAHLSMLEHDGLQKILERSRAAGVVKQISVSTEPDNWKKNCEIAEKETDVYYTLGVHPHEAKFWPEWKKELLERTKNGVPNKCVAIGEIGLDYHYNHSTREEQISALRAQIEVAQKLNLPLVIHCRNAFEDLFETLHSVGIPEKKGVMHCFTGTADEALKSVSLGFKISFSGILTFKGAQDLRDTAKQLPLTEILVETDCPFLTPVPHRGKPNEPALITFTVQTLALTLGKSVEEVADATANNAIRLFDLK